MKKLFNVIELDFYLQFLHIIKTLTMVDRYQSLVESIHTNDNMKRNMKVQKIYNISQQMIQKTNQHSTKLRKIIQKYKQITGPDGDAVINEFKKEQQQFISDRNVLKKQFDKTKEGTPEHNFIKRQLLRAVKNEIDLQLQLNKVVTCRKEEKEKLKKDLIGGSPKIAAAVRDIEAKLQDIKYLQRSISQCLHLLQIINVLVIDQGMKIQSVLQQVKIANREIEKAERNIDKAKIYMQKSRCKMCCIIILALIAIIVILIVLFGLDVIHL